MEEVMLVLSEVQKMIGTFAHSTVGIGIQAVLLAILFAMIFVPNSKSGPMLLRKNAPGYAIFCMFVVFFLWVMPSFSVDAWYGMFAMAGLFFVGLIPSIIKELRKAKAPKNVAVNQSFSRSN